MSTSERMLRLLSLLQTHRYWPGPELSERLEVSPRTLRRDVDRLRDLGYTVDAVRGAAGGYQLRAGGSLPPLLLEDEEAVAVAVGLRTAAAGAVAGMDDWSVQALSKVLSLMPPRLRRQMDAVASQTDSPGPWEGAPVFDAAVLTTLAQACRDSELLRFDYTAREGEASHRRIEPLRLVSLGRRWYLVAWDRDRMDWRSFRLDRIADPEPTGQRFRPRDLPADDALAFVRQGISRMPQRYAVRARVAMSADDLAAHVGRWGTVTPDGAGCVLEMNVDDLGWPVMVLAGTGADFVVESPPELVERVAEVGARFSRSAGPG
ncbi:YafY family transcriptional regulator [Nocardioides cavernae]|uniref:helix-turn-helix transcriptional regulator n=1 Tax=Nocardioides TaxID=1839 RepID=UPI001910F99B|nr:MULTISPECIES: YafY family protein [Nocardioides]MCK9822092.1 YafY family transcriptional regulator [Nocardioides cavernae]